MNSISRPTILILGITIGAVVLSVSLVLGFSEPTQAPPGGNVVAPLNVSGTAQTKTGGLILNTGGATDGLLVWAGNVGIGVPTPSYKLDVAGTVAAANFAVTGATGGA